MRRFANDEEPGTTAEIGADAARKQLTECWLRCDKCKRWRVVERASLPALKPEEYSKRREGCIEVDWVRWLGEAQGRYGAFLQRHRGQDAACDVESEEKLADDVEAEHTGVGQDGDDERELVGALSEGSASSEVGTSECGSDDECRHVSGKKESLAAAWGRALVVCVAAEAV